MRHDKRPGGPSFTVAVEAGFAEDGVWVVDARLKFAQPAVAGSALLGEGRLALLKRIAEEGLRGRQLGAKIVRVRMSGHDGAVDAAAVELNT